MEKKITKILQVRNNRKIITTKTMDKPRKPNLKVLTRRKKHARGKNMRWGYLFCPITGVNMRDLLINLILIQINIILFGYIILQILGFISGYQIGQEIAQQML